MNDERRLFEYFIVAGLSDEAEELTPLAHECGNKAIEQVAPITDLTVIFPGLGETVPEGFECIATTPTGHPADLNHGSIRTHSAFLCYRRGYHKPPLVDIGVLDESRGEKPMIDATVIERTPQGRIANVNNSSNGLYFTYRRSGPNAPPHQLVITHICVILANRNEVPPHTYYKIDKNLNKGMLGSDVYVCYKKSPSMSKVLAYKPRILDCFPKVENLSLAQNVPMFCLPMGAVLESWSRKCGPPEMLFSTCVLTDEVGTKYYGASLTFYEKYTKQLTESQLEKLDLNSDLPDGENNDNATSEDQNNIEQQGDEMYEVTFPSPSRPRVLVQLRSDMISFESHDDTQIPLSGAVFVDSLKNLSVDNFIYVMLLALLEQKILVHSLRPWLLTTVAETVCALMFPFHWQCPYIPQCPLPLAGVLHAPLPFIAGVDSRYFDLYEDPPSDVTCFDLDTATISQSNVRKSLKLSILPKKPTKRLRQALELILTSLRADEATRANLKKNSENYSADWDQKIQQRKMTYELRIREAFLKFMCSLMTGYSQHLRPIKRAPHEINATDTGALFNLDSFLKSRDKNALEFYRRFCETQCFIRFIEERSFVSDKNAYNAFFDDCIKKLDRDGKNADLQLLDTDAYSPNHTIVVPPPELLCAKSQDDQQYTYDHFPHKFNHDLFETEQILKSREGIPCDQTFQQRNEKTHFAFIRTKQEARSSVTDAAGLLEISQGFWPRTLLFYSYSLWFLQLPSLIQLSKNKIKVLRLAFKVLNRMEQASIPFHDQVCYRTLIQLCGEYGKPHMAMKILQRMQCLGLEPNAITYGIYHRAIMQGEWPTPSQLNAIDAWKRIRFLVEGCSRFRAPLKNLALMQQETSYAASASTNALSAFDTSAMESPHLSLNASNASLSSGISSQETESLSTNVQERDAKSLENQPYVITVIPLDKPDNKDESSSKISDEQTPNATATSELDPLNASIASEESRSKSLDPRTVMSPSRQQFLREMSASPFAEELNALDAKREHKSKKGFKFGGSWLKGLTSTPIMSKIMRSQTAEDVTDAQQNTSVQSTELNRSSISGSPSISSLVNSVRKQAIRGYGDIVQQGNVLLNKINRNELSSGVNSLVNEMKNLNKSYSKNATAYSTDENLNGTFGATLEFNDPAFQLDSGTTGDLLSFEWWMKDIFEATASDPMVQDVTNAQAIDVAICSCTPCTNCHSLIYDEELMAGWTLDDSNLNTVCASCSHTFVPSLKVRVQNRSQDLTSSWYFPLYHAPDGINPQESPVDENKPLVDTLSVPFLNPLVLRRELETLLAADSLVLTQPSVRSSHPIIFWNLVYYCRRLDLPSHIYGWIAPNVHVRCVYDLLELHSEAEPSCLPIYFANHPKNGLISEPMSSRIVRLWQQVIDSLQQNNLSRIIKCLINEHREIKETVGIRAHFPIYRDILFVALDRFNRSVDREQFDRQFQQEFERIPPRILSLLPQQDCPPKPLTIACRRIFLPLDML